MDRRSFLKAGFGLAVSPMALANNNPTGTSPIGFATRKAWVANPYLIQQNCPQWCWAASIAMIFASHGHPVNQQRIVKETYGALTCASGWPTTIAADLSRPWVDDYGHPFTASITAAYDQVNGINAINNYFIVNELTANRPLMYCNQHHAMVLVAVDYADTYSGPDIFAAGVFDPWPYSPGYHSLSTTELIPAFNGGQMMMLAAVQIT